MVVRLTARHSVSSVSARKLCRTWNGRLAHYRRHRNDEHLAALLDEAVRYVGLYLENDLFRSRYWSSVPLGHAASILLFLVDKGIVERTVRHGRRTFEPLPHAESWLANQTPLSPYLSPLRELVTALRLDLNRRIYSRKS